MSSSSLVELVRGESQNDVAVITLNNPKVNALSSALLAELEAVAKDLTANPAGAVVITGGARLFAAGANISEFSGPEDARRIGGAFRSALDAVAAIPRATIAAISGFALGGGCELALACDFRIASTRAVFGQPEIMLGIIPGGGGTQRLARLVGPAKAKNLIFTGRQVKAPEALSMGLADEMVEPDQLMTRVMELANELASGAVVAQALSKQAIDQGLSTDLASGLALEQDLFEEVFRTEDSQIGVASFLENGPGHATFTGR